jgi:hypothetical protein
MFLGDYFTDDQISKLNATLSNLKKGTVIKMFIPTTKPPKEKCFIVVGANLSSISLATCYINSKINTNVLNTPELVQLQVVLSANNYDFLSHDSFVDCSQLNEVAYSTILDKLSDTEWRKEIIVGQINETDLSIILDTIRNADTTDPIFLEKYNI